MRIARRPTFDFSFAACVLFVCLAAVRCGSSDSNTSPTGGGNTITGGGNTNANTGGGNTITGGGNTSTGTNSNTVTLLVAVQTFAFDTVAATLDANLLKFGLNDPNIAFGAGGAPYDQNNIPTTQCATAGGVQGCVVTLNNVDVSAYTHGLLLFTTDNRASTSSPAWKGIYTYVPQASITAARAASGHVLNVRAAAVSDGGESVIGTWGGGTGAAYISNGATLGVVETSTGAGVSGVTVNAGTGYTVTYANDGGTAQGTTSTGTGGFFLAASNTAGYFNNTDWTLTPATSGMTWDTSYTGSAKLALTVFFFTPQ